MPRGAKVYRRLPGRESGLLSYSRLWLGPDHLLLARTTFFSEEYKRFYFRDIQAIVMRRTRRHLIWAWMLAILFGLCVAVLCIGFFDLSGRSIQPSDTIGLLVWGVPALLCLALLYLNFVRGPGCICHVRTAVQIEELSPLKRFRTTWKVIERLKPGIEIAQGPLAPELLQPKPPSVFAAPPSETAAQSAGQAPPSTGISP
jgi:hypothetical protein